MVKVARILPAAVPSRCIGFEHTEGFEPRPLGLQPASNPRPFAEQRLMRDLNGTAASLGTLVHYEAPAIEACEQLLLFFAEARPLCDATGSGTLLVDLRECGHENRGTELVEALREPAGQHWYILLRLDAA